MMAQARVCPCIGQVLRGREPVSPCGAAAGARQYPCGARAAGVRMSPTASTSRDIS